MIIGITGYGATGASAYIDLIKEFEGVQSYKGNVEFQLLQQPDGINDLKYFLVDAKRRINTNAAIHRFIRVTKGKSAYNMGKFTHGRFDALSREYVDDIAPLRWKGRSNYDPADLCAFYDTKTLKPINNRINKLFNDCHLSVLWPRPRERFFALWGEEDFTRRTRKFLTDILEAGGFDLARPVILEQLFSCMNPLAGAEYFSDVRSLVIDRDPRDVFLATSRQLATVASFMPTNGDVEQFITYYKLLHQARVDDPRVKYVHFEDLVYHYEDSCAMLQAWLGLAHTQKKTHFRPEISVANTAMYKKCPELRADFEAIERALPEYLYPFDEAEKSLNFVPENDKPFLFTSEVTKKR